MSSEHSTETRELVDFDAVVLSAHGDLTIEQGDHTSITIEADRKVVEKLKTEVVDGVLNVGLVGTWFTRFRTAVKAELTSHKIKYVIKLKHLSRLEVLGSARVHVEELETESLQMLVDGAGYVRIGWIEADSIQVDLPGASNVELAGKVGRQEVDLGGLGKYQAPRLTSDTARVDLVGAGKAVVAVRDELEVIVRGLGHVGYHGDPRVNKDITGLGKIEHLGALPDDPA